MPDGRMTFEMSTVQTPSTCACVTHPVCTVIVPGGSRVHLPGTAQVCWNHGPAQPAAEGRGVSWASCPQSLPDVHSQGWGACARPSSLALLSRSSQPLMGKPPLGRVSVTLVIWDLGFSPAGNLSDTNDAPWNREPRHQLEADQSAGCPGLPFHPQESVCH